MADEQNNDENKNNNDEYRFDELDALESPSERFDESMPNEEAETQTLKKTDQREQIIRKSLMVAGGLVAMIVVYKLFTGFFGSKATDTELKPAAPVPVAEVKPFVEQPKPVAAVVPDKVAELETKLNAVSISNQNTQDTVGNLNNQVQTLSSDVSRLQQQMETLNESLQRTQAMIQSQSQDIARLVAKANQPRYVHRPTVRKPAIRIRYAIQAVIPGRAWLIGSNGSTITVRDGSEVPGYGRIKMIDSVQGKIYTSSGRMIEFSPQDS